MGFKPRVEHRYTHIHPPTHTYTQMKNSIYFLRRSKWEPIFEFFFFLSLEILIYFWSLIFLTSTPPSLCQSSPEGELSCSYSYYFPPALDGVDEFLSFSWLTRPSLSLCTHKSRNRSGKVRFVSKGRVEGKKREYEGKLSS